LRCLLIREVFLSKGTVLKTSQEGTKKLDRIEELQDMLQSQLKPLVKKIDAEAYYPEEYLRSLGRDGYLTSESMEESEYLLREVQVVEETSKVCMTTGFNLWCDLAALTYIRKSSNEYLKKEILPQLEGGKLLAGTGLSNPMKYYAGLESLHLKAKRTENGYVLNGILPSVSNLGPDHWFGVVAETEGDSRVMALVPCKAEGLTLKAKLEYLGINGSATYSCDFKDVFIPAEWVISEQADEFIPQIRPAFVIYQIPLGLGVTEASINSIRQVCNKQGGCNSFLPVQPEELEEELKSIRAELYKVCVSGPEALWKEILELRLRTVYMTTKAVHACMLHQGGAGYLQNSAPSRRLRESYFLVNLTPTVKHLEKMIRSL
jgi:hypothetical protein